MKTAIALILVFLIACTMQQQTEVQSKPASTEPIRLPPAPILTPEPKVAQEPPVIVQPPAPVQPTPPQNISLEQQCMIGCEQDCETSAHTACTQRERSLCKARCGEIIDPSACTQACTYISQPTQCKMQLEKFCSAQCVSRCK